MGDRKTGNPAPEKVRPRRPCHLPPSVLSVSFDSLAPASLALRANLRLLYLPPATALGCG
jgi:hypothetical protein